MAKQKRSLEDAIASVERDYAKSVPETDPLAELEHIFSSIDRNKNQPSHTRQPVKAEPAWPAPPVAKPEPYKPRTVSACAAARRENRAELAARTGAACPEAGGPAAAGHACGSRRWPG